MLSYPWSHDGSPTKHIPGRCRVGVRYEFPRCWFQSRIEAVFISNDPVWWSGSFIYGCVFCCILCLSMFYYVLLRLSELCMASSDRALFGSSSLFGNSWYYESVCFVLFTVDTDTFGNINSISVYRIHECILYLWFGYNRYLKILICSYAYMMSLPSSLAY